MTAQRVKTQEFRIGLAHTFVRTQVYAHLCARCGRQRGDITHNLPDPVTLMTCREAGCRANAAGWFMALDVEGNAGHAEFATFIKERSGRRYYEWRAPYALEEALRREASGDLTVTPELRACLEGLAPGFAVFAFPPGQTCFRAHEDREVAFVHDQRVHVNGRDFNEDFNESADRVGVLRQRG